MLVLISYSVTHIISLYILSVAQGTGLLPCYFWQTRRSCGGYLWWSFAAWEGLDLAFAALYGTSWFKQRARFKWFVIVYFRSQFSNVCMMCTMRRLAFCLYFATEMCLIFNIAYPLKKEHSHIYSPWDASRQRHHTSKAGVIVREQWRCFGPWKWLGDVMMELDLVVECYEFGCVLWSKSTPEV